MCEHISMLILHCY